MATRSDALRLRIELEGKEAQRVMDQFTRKVQTGNKKIQASNAKTVRSYKGLQLSIAQMRNATLLATFAITGTVFTLDKLAKRAEKVSALSSAFDTLSARIGATPAILNRLRDATRGAVSQMDLMKQVNNAVILGVAQTEDQFVKLAEGATKLGRAVGLDAAASLESLTTGIGRQSRQMLDNLGIIVQAEVAQNTYAKSIGKTVAQLTDLEKKTAFAEEATRQMEFALLGLGEGVDNLSDKWNQASTTIGDSVDFILGQVNRLPGVFAALEDGTITTSSAFDRMGAVLRESQDPATVLITTLAALNAEIDGTASKSRDAFLAIERLFQERVLAGAPTTEQLARQVALVEAQRAKIEEMKAALVGIKVPLEEMELSYQNMLDAQKTFAADPVPELPPDLGVGEVITPEALMPDLDQMKAPVSEFASFFQAEMGGVEGAADRVTSVLVQGAIDGKIAWGEFMKRLLADLAAAIIKAKILAAISAAGAFGGGGGGGAGGTVVSSVFAKGGIIGAQQGALIRGGSPGRDSVLVGAQRGEAVLPKDLTSFLRRAAGRSLRESTSIERTDRASTPTVIVVQSSQVALPENIEANPEAVIESLRRANLLGV